MSCLTITNNSVKRNKGFDTEDYHFSELSRIFGVNNVSAPKNSGRGSDFLVITNNCAVTFESKTKFTDQFDAGTVSAFANGLIYSASGFLTNNHIHSIESVLKVESDALAEYVSAMGVDRIPHNTTKEKYEKVKTNGKLVHIQRKNLLDNIVEATFCSSKNKFNKADYIIIGSDIFRVKQNYDPLALNAPVLNNDYINFFGIRTARSGSSKTGNVSVSLRVNYKLHSIPTTTVKLESL